ncbi:MAG: hypothetical protein RM049_38570 [Nostoc sp. DedQUE04]|uniref:hypothetical protein n=1 Tax=Nostoc sp. DedQUE04 TaxID=3075390 RepID=UPI002AD5432C|nr:hypothetical protein [Nostoc sp. DedQUE04]MDZ8141127.1 hypothetical protein [Nostoc sp. DedQUE04]
MGREFFYNTFLLLKHPLNDDNYLWLKCQELGKKIDIPKLETLSDFIENQNHSSANLTGILPFTAIGHKPHLHLRGEINALQIHDTYALDLTFRYHEPEVQIDDLTGLNPHQYLLPKNINSSLGQTLLLFAEPLGNIQDYQAFANACLINLLLDATVNKLQIYCQSQRKLLGSPIFEYNNNADYPQEQCHILIWLNIYFTTTELETKGDYYYPLIDILNCRSKIIYARSQAIWCNQQAREDFSKLENKLKAFNQLKHLPTNAKLQQLNQWLNEIPKISFSYSRYLRDLQFHKNTIKTNSKNLALYLNKLKSISLPEDDLEFISSFLGLAETTFVEQIDVDLGYLMPAQNLFDQMINTIRGIVEIEQDKSDRSLESIIQVLGIGFGGGAIVSGIVTTHINKINLPLVPKNPFSASLILSLITTLAFMGLGWLITKRK